MYESLNVAVKMYTNNVLNILYITKVQSLRRESGCITS